jgi:hypothetical protein
MAYTNGGGAMMRFCRSLKPSGGRVMTSQDKDDDDDGDKGKDDEADEDNDTFVVDRGGAVVLE